ncbi:MAG: LOG family protein [Deltaproteobacteria bacterium]|nr:LOG family protein [Deltaproteobacteria bacterium]
MNDTSNGLTNAALDEAINHLMESIEDGKRAEHRDLTRRMLRTVLKIQSGELDRLDMKIMERSLRELYKGFKTFKPWRDRRKFAIFGSARSKPGSPEYEAAVTCAEKLVKAGHMVVTGAGPGIMQAGNQGAGPENSFGVNITLPFEASANPYIDKDKLVDFKYFFTRKVVFVKEVDGIILFPGGFGTQDECFEALTLIQTGKAEPQPVVMIDPPGSTYWRDWDRYVQFELLGRGLISPNDVHLFKITSDIDKAIEHIDRFYGNFHSIRYVDGRLVMRLQHQPSAQTIELLNEEFTDIVVEGRIESCEMYARESDEPQTADLHRISFKFNQRHLGRLRMMIDVLNASLTEDQRRTGAQFPPVHGVIPGMYPGNEDADENGD